MNWEELQRGRRRNWEKLRDPSERAREAHERKLREMQEEEERKREAAAVAAAQVPAPPGYGDEAVRKALEQRPKEQESFHKRRKRRLAEQRARDIAEFIRAKRQVIMLALSVVALVVTLYAVRYGDEYLRNRRMLAQFRLYTELVFTGERVQDFSTPYGALASWRGAWRRKSAEDVWRSLSPGRQLALSQARDYRRYIRELQNAMNSGGAKNARDMSAMFEAPEWVRLPKRPYRDGDLALFRSPPYKAENSSGPPEKLIAAFSFDRDSGEWRFAEVREAPFFSVRWTLEGQIAARSLGMAAQRYDEKTGEPIAPGGSGAPARPRNTADRLNLDE